MYNDSYDSPFACYDSSSGFCGIPQAEDILGRKSQGYYDPPPRTRGNYSGYDSFGNVVNRQNRGSAVQNVEDLYHGGSQIRSFPDLRRSHSEAQKRCTCGAAHVGGAGGASGTGGHFQKYEHELLEMKQQHKIFIYFLIFVIAFSLFSKNGFLADILFKNTKKVYGD